MSNFLLVFEKTEKKLYDIGVFFWKKLRKENSFNKSKN